MTKTLIIMRHAKSDWSTGVEDFDRPLNKRGFRDAEKMGGWLKKRKLIPDIIVSSPAKRAKQTIKIVCEHIGKDPGKIIWDERVYEAGLDDLVKVVMEHGKNAKYILLAGHNPGLDHLVNYFSKERPPHTAAGKLMTTAAIAVMEFDKGFNGKQGSGEVVKLARPKEL